MKFLFQKNIWQEYNYDRLLESVAENGIDFQEVHVVPFTDHFDEQVDFIPSHCFGSGRFVNICRQLDFRTFPSFKPLEEFYPKELWVNGLGYDCKWIDLKIDHPVFVKPYTEKFFTGLVIEDQEDLGKVQLATSFVVEDEEIVRVSELVRIEEEIRFFVIGGTIISGSYYKVHGRNKQFRIQENHLAWSYLVDIIRKYGIIADGFVIDLGLTDQGWKIVELNNLNSAGIYETDTNAIVRALKYL